jgi:hypothetical protein
MHDLSYGDDHPIKMLAEGADFANYGGSPAYKLGDGDQAQRPRRAHQTRDYSSITWERYEQLSPSQW